MEPNFLELALRMMLNEENESATKSFLFTYRRFTTPSKLLTLWIDNFLIYRNENSLDETQNGRVVYARLRQFLKYWLTSYLPLDFSDSDYNRLLQVLEKNFSLEEKIELKLFVLKGYSLKRTYNFKSIKKAPSKAKPLKKGRSETMVSLSDFLSGGEIMTLKASDIATALTVKEARLYKRIHPVELLSKGGWDKTLSSYHIDNMIHHFNKVGYWVTTEVITRNGKDQIETLEKMIKIAWKCRKLNNYNGVMEVLSGLNNHSIQRLKKLWNSILEKYRKKFQMLDELMNPFSNFKNYNNEINEKSLQAVLPHFGLFVRDFTSIIQGCEHLTEDSKINTELIKGLYDRSQAFLKFQSSNFKLATTLPEVDKFLANLVFIEDDELLYELSVKQIAPSQNSPKVSMSEPLTNSIRGSQQLA